MPPCRAAFRHRSKTLCRAMGQSGFSTWEEPVGGPFPSPICGKHLAQGLRQHHLPILVAFAAADPDDAAFTVQVGYLQVGYFRDAEPCAVHRGQNRPMAEIL